MRNWARRILGREGLEKSESTQRELNDMERKTRQLEMRVEHLRRERMIYERQQRNA